MAVILKSAYWTLILCMAVVMAAYVAEAAITCARVSNLVAPCIPYASAAGKVSKPPPKECCSGIKSLNDAANTTPDRQAACYCLKSLLGAVPDINHDVVEGLPKKCGVNIPYRIHPSTDCKSVK